MKGTIVKGIAGFYYVKEEGRDTPAFQCKARGVFKKDGIVPAVGDHVAFQLGEGPEDDGLITQILPRKNQFIRPPIVNVDCFVVIMAAAHPKPNLALMDKFLVMAEKSSTDIIVCLNKLDLAKGGLTEEIQRLYGDVYPVVCLSAESGKHIEELRGLIRGKQTAFAGPSGVGKSTLLNALLPSAAAQTGDVSKKTKRGRHTTRHCELFDLGDGTMIFDTPGFTSFEIMEAEEDELQHLFPEMEPFLGACRYDDCRHLKEPGCMVRQAVEEGKIPRGRYESYKVLLGEIQAKNRY
ncbi:MAG: ribosome small subunit-dependent GTPase A [Firmicutes bacterium]|nr:ribosome small subunit-dependent GTPase A [Bacillota bacterium]NBI63115.1 ribosome small subunit-dependent GTPase A [Clostridiales bacterium]